MTTNQERINRAEQAVDAVMSMTGDADASAAISDLLADLMHFCREHKIDFKQKLIVAETNFQLEVEVPAPPPPVEEITPEIFRQAHRIRLTGVGTDEEFVITKFGRTHIAVSIPYGYNYTRPQLIDKYKRNGSTFEVTEKRHEPG